MPLSTIPSARPWGGPHEEGYDDGLGGTRWDFRGIFVVDGDFAACLAAMPTMNLNTIECQAFTGSNDNIVARRMDGAAAGGAKGWTYFGGGFTPANAPGGGSFAMSDAKITSLLNTGYTGAGGTNVKAKDHAANSHRYQIVDEINLTAYTGVDLAANLQKFSDRAALIKTIDPLAIVNVTEFRQAQLQPPNDIWNGVVDEIWSDGYPFPEATTDTTKIPDQAGWSDSAGTPYVATISCHDFGAGHVTPAYPTQVQFTAAMNQWKATHARGIIVYIWNDAEGVTHLSGDASMQAHIGSEMAKVM